MSSVRVECVGGGRVETCAWACYEECLDHITRGDGSGLERYLLKLNPTMRAKVLNISVRAGESDGAGGAGGTLPSYVIQSKMSVDAAMKAIHALVKMGAPTSCKMLRSLVFGCIVKPNTDFIRIAEALFMSFPGLLASADDFLCAAVKYSNFPAVCSIAAAGGNCRKIFPGNITLLHVAATACARFRQAQRHLARVSVDMTIFMAKVHRKITMFLLRHGVDPKAKDDRNDTPVDILRRCTIAQDLVDMMKECRFLSRPNSHRGQDEDEDEHGDENVGRFRQCVVDLKTLHTDMLPMVPLFAPTVAENLAKMAWERSATTTTTTTTSPTAAYMGEDRRGDVEMMFASPEDCQGVGTEGTDERKATFRFAFACDACGATIEGAPSATVDSFTSCDVCDSVCYCNDACKNQHAAEHASTCNGVKMGQSAKGTNKKKKDRRTKKKKK